MSDSTIKTLTFETDKLQRFIFDDCAVRGEWVHLTDTWQSVLNLRQYPQAVQTLLGEMMTAAALLTASVKMQGRLVLQLKSTGPISLMMVECTSRHTLRAFAQWQGELDSDTASLQQLTGEGALAITIDVEGAKQPYQGIVGLQGDSLAELLERYFEQSEQLNTRIWLAADQQSTAGLLLQQLPNESHDFAQEQENWARLTQLASTTQADELLNLGMGNLLHRLFHEEACRLLSATDLRFACNCSRQRVADSIRLLGEKDALALIAEQGNIEVACEFCNKQFRFDRAATEQVFLAQQQSEQPEPTLH